MTGIISKGINLSDITIVKSFKDLDKDVWKKISTKKSKIFTTEADAFFFHPTFGPYQKEGHYLKLCEYTKIIRKYTPLIRIGRALLGVTAVVASLFTGLYFKEIRDLFTKKGLEIPQNEQTTKLFGKKLSEDEVQNILKWKKADHIKTPENASKFMPGAIRAREQHNEDGIVMFGASAWPKTNLGTKKSNEKNKTDALLMKTKCFDIENNIPEDFR